MTREEMCQAVRDSFDAGDFGDASVYIGEVIDSDPEDPNGFASFPVHKGGLDADIFYVRVYKVQRR